MLCGLTFSAVASAQECETAPSKATLESAAKIEQLLENGLVQFGGYLAMVSYAQTRDDCANGGVFENLYVAAVDKMPETKMVMWRDWSKSQMDFQMDAATAVEGFGGECKVKFDLPRAGAPEKIRVTCDNPQLKSPLRRAMKQVVFAPPTLNEGFKTAKDVEFEFALTRRIDDWVF